jgi:streptogramin lyase
MNEGPDGNLYLSDQTGVSRLVTHGPQTGQTDEYPLTCVCGGGTNSVAAGPDGYLYETDGGTYYSTHGYLHKIAVP